MPAARGCRERPSVSPSREAKSTASNAIHGDPCSKLLSLRIRPFLAERSCEGISLLIVRAMVGVVNDFDAALPSLVAFGEAFAPAAQVRGGP